MPEDLNDPQIVETQARVATALASGLTKHVVDRLSRNHRIMLEEREMAIVECIMAVFATHTVVAEGIGKS